MDLLQKIIFSQKLFKQLVLNFIMVEKLKNIFKEYEQKCFKYHCFSCNTNYCLTTLKHECVFCKSKAIVMSKRKDIN